MKGKIKIVLVSINVFLISVFLGIPAYALQNTLSGNSSDVSDRLLPISDDISMFIPSEKKIQDSFYQIHPIPLIKPDTNTYRILSTNTLNNILKITSLNYTNRAKPGEIVNISFTVDGYIENTNYYIGIYDWASGTWIKDDSKYHNGTFSKKYDWNISTMPTGQKYWSYWLSAWYWEPSNSSWIYLDGSDIIIYLILPDLTVKDIIFSNNIALVNISNSGYSTASNVSYKVFDGNPNTNYMNNNSYRKTELIHGDNIPILNNSEFNLISISFPIDQDFHKAYVVVDPSDTIKETNESNNNASKAIRLNSSIHALDVLAVIYTNYVYNNLSTSQIDFTESQINDFKNFYWDQTLTLSLNLSYMQIDDLYNNSHLWEISPGKFWMSPWDVESDLRNRGVTDNAFDTIYVFYAWNNTNGSEAAYGGAAYGPGINWMGNTSYASEPIFCWDPNTIGEIAIHEVLHNIDGMYEEKGDSSFKNSDNMRSETTFEIPMDYYEWMLETWPTQKWFELKWGTILVKPSTGSVHNINKGTNYTTIQAAINDANQGDEIHVDSGTYYENVNVTKPLILRGIGMPVVDARGSGSAIILVADGITLEGFTTTGAGSYSEAGIKVTSSNNTLSRNDVRSNYGIAGIYLIGSSNSGMLSSAIAKKLMKVTPETYTSLFSEGDIKIIYQNLISAPRSIVYYQNINNNILSNNRIFNNTGDGILLSYSSDSTIKNNKVWENYKGGIELQDYSKNNVIYNNTVTSNNWSGITIRYSYSENNTVDNNNVSLNKNGGGILVWIANNNTITNNTAISNAHEGISSEYTYNNVINKNFVKANAWWGVIVYYSQNITVSDNTAISNLDGINLGYSSNNTITNNNASSINYYGIALWNSSSNSIYHNNLKYNTNQGIDNTGANSWYSGYPSGGNYWSDYIGIDLKSGSSQNIPGGDGIGDAPYNISGGGGAQDKYPFMNESGWVEHMDTSPVAECGADKLKCENVGSPVQFNGSASYDPDGVIISYDWEFGDGTNVTGVTPVHKYSTHRWNGTVYQPFTVNLTVTDNAGMTNRKSQKVVIWIAGDGNGDGKVNILDASIIGLKWNSNPADPCADLNNDGKVNILDASIIGLNWGRKP